MELRRGSGFWVSLGTGHWQWLPSEWQVTIRQPSRCQLTFSSCFEGGKEAIRSGSGQQSTHGPGRGPSPPDTTYLAAEEMGKHSTALKVPDDNEASAVANEDLVGVTGVLLQSFHHLKHPPVAGLLWQPRQGSAMSPCNSGYPTCQPGKMVGPATSQ